MTAYATAWLVVVVAASLVAGLLFFALRRLRHWRYPIVGLTLAWSLTPYPFDDENTAPAFVVATFRLLFEDGAAPRPPLVLLLLVSLGVVLAYFLGWGVHALWKIGARNIQRKDAPPAAAIDKPAVHQLDPALDPAQPLDGGRLGQDD